jgi:hypothetical protein
MLAPWNTADISDYCNGLLHLLDEPDVPWSIKRSKITAWAALPLAKSVGIMSSLRWSSAVATVLVGGGLYLWGRLIAGRTAGLLSSIAGRCWGDHWNCEAQPPFLGLGRGWDRLGIAR